MFEMCRFSFIMKIQIEWGSEYGTSLIFKWSRRGWMPNGVVFKSHLKPANGRHLVFLCVVVGQQPYIIGS